MFCVLPGPVGLRQLDLSPNCFPPDLEGSAHSVKSSRSFSPQVACLLGFFCPGRLRGPALGLKPGLGESLGFLPYVGQTLFQKSLPSLKQNSLCPNLRHFTPKHKGKVPFPELEGLDSSFQTFRW